jgi:hypothetical protein
MPLVPALAKIVKSLTLMQYAVGGASSDSVIRKAAISDTLAACCMLWVTMMIV